MLCLTQSPIYNIFLGNYILLIRFHIMRIKIENKSSSQLSDKTIEMIHRVINTIPADHLRGIEKLRIVNTIADMRLRPELRATLPGMYHPRQGNQPAWLEVALDVLKPSSLPFYKRWMQRISFKSNVASTIFSLVGQHYHLTKRHSIRKNQLENLVRNYAQTQLRSWAAGEHTIRTRLFKPLQPTFERWAMSLQRRAKRESKKTGN